MAPRGPSRVPSDGPSRAPRARGIISLYPRPPGSGDGGKWIYAWGGGKWFYPFKCGWDFLMNQPCSPWADSNPITTGSGKVSREVGAVSPASNPPLSHFQALGRSSLASEDCYAFASGILPRW